MKKLMVTLAAVAMATVVRASAVDWEIYTYNPGDAGTMVYLVSQVEEYASAADIANSSYLLGVGASGSFAEDMFDGATASGTVSGLTQAERGDVPFYFVIVDGDKGYWTSPLQTGTAYVVETPDPVSYDADALMAGSSTPWASGPTPPGPEPIPEPTSGLLLLLGVAGLALKRRRA